ncbi:TPA: hypothetical protein HA251_02810 [Candidatus Woesearchaeota archaeon]|nr:hypothetical protein [Candidatus Woesearchaeota archaeon]
MNQSIKHTLSGLVLAAAFGATACGGPACSGPAQSSQPIETITGVPLDKAQRTQTTGSTNESYLFPIKVGTVETCAYRDPGRYTSGESMYDLMVISLAEKRQQPISFQTTGRRSNDGCYVMASSPQPVRR